MVVAVCRSLDVTGQLTIRCMTLDTRRSGMWPHMATILLASFACATARLVNMSSFVVTVGVADSTRSPSL